MDQQTHVTETPPLVFFDGVCNLCNGTVQFILKRERSHTLLFAPLQGETFRSYFFEDSKYIPDSIVFIENGKFFTQSTAVLRIGRYLKQPWRALAAVGWIFPEWLRDCLYRWIARNRYSWFGQKEACYIPTAELKSRFLP